MKIQFAEQINTFVRDKMSRDERKTKHSDVQSNCNSYRSFLILSFGRNQWLGPWYPSHQRPLGTATPSTHFLDVLPLVEFLTWWSLQKYNWIIGEYPFIVPGGPVTTNDTSGLRVCDQYSISGQNSPLPIAGYSGYTNICRIYVPAHLCLY